MSKYLELKSELPQMCEIVEKFPEQLQEKVLDILIAGFSGADLAAPAPAVAREDVNLPVVAPPTVSRTHRRAPTDSMHMISHLNLSPSGQPSLVDFVNEKRPKSAQEFNTVAVYYLAKTLSVEAISPDHVYTCYKKAKQRPPSAFVQSLRDTAGRQAWIDVTDLKSIRLAIRGETLVDHDLPRVGSNKGKEKQL